ncbi:MAG: hypothetical protein LC099_06260 [Anaerolineales bacterium]|nr:hypothetical protein [Anaerolineales bacterium]
MAIKSKAKPSSKEKAAPKKESAAKPTGAEKTVAKKKKPAATEAAAKRTTVVNRVRKPMKSARKERGSTSSNLFSFMKAPRLDLQFEVGDAVEVFCDHEKGRERVRGWLRGIVAQVDNKMVAAQFRTNVFLTDGWMVPDRILWYPLNSEHIRPATSGKKPAPKKIEIPDY